MAQSEKKRESRGYKVILTGIKGILRLLVIACLLVVLVYLGRRSYALGREAFTEKPVDIGGGRTIVVTITDDMSTYQIGKMLRAEESFLTEFYPGRAEVVQEILLNTVREHVIDFCE